MINICMVEAFREQQNKSDLNTNLLEDAMLFAYESRCEVSRINDNLNRCVLSSIQENSAVYLEEGVGNFFKAIGNFFANLWKSICKAFSSVIGWIKNVFKKSKDGKDEKVKDGAQKYLEAEKSGGRLSTSASSSPKLIPQKTREELKDIRMQNQMKNDRKNVSRADGSVIYGDRSDPEPEPQKPEPKSNDKPEPKPDSNDKSDTKELKKEAGWSYDGLFKFQYAVNQTQNITSRLMQEDEYERVKSGDQIIELANSMMDKNNIQKGEDMGKIKEVMTRFNQGNHIENIYDKYANEFLHGTIDDNHRIIKNQTAHLELQKNEIKKYIDNMTIKLERDQSIAAKKKEEYQVNRFKHVNSFLAEMNTLFNTAYSIQCSGTQKLASDIAKCKSYFASIGYKEGSVKEAVIEKISNDFLNDLATI